MYIYMYVDQITNLLFSQLLIYRVVYFLFIYRVVFYVFALKDGYNVPETLEYSLKIKILLC